MNRPILLALYLAPAWSRPVSDSRSLPVDLWQFQDATLNKDAPEPVIAVAAHHKRRSKSDLTFADQSQLRGCVKLVVRPQLALAHPERHRGRSPFRWAVPRPSPDDHRPFYPAWPRPSTSSGSIAHQGTNRPHRHSQAF